MERKTLQPGQIIVPGEYELGNETILKIYFRVFDSGKGEILPPCLVTHKSKIQSNYLRKTFVDEKRADEFYQRLMDSDSEYLLFDGNHKSVAATLCHTPIDSLELQTGKDVREVRKMVRDGGLFNFPHEENSVIKIANEFISYIFSPANEMVMTVEERVDKLVSNGDLPKYMRNRYLRRE